MRQSTNIRTFTWSYHRGRGLKSTLEYPNGLVASWTYDSRGNLVQVRNAFPTNIISQYDYTYDALSRRIAIARSGSAMNEASADVYGYNTRNELVSSRKSTMNAPEYAYEYDDIGNRISSFELGTNRIYTANNLNQYVSISNLSASASSAGEFLPQYDLDGNQTLIQTSTGIWQVSYNGENRPVLWTSGPTNIVMAYDRLGRRVKYLETVAIDDTIVTNSFRTFTYDGYLQIANTEHVTGVSQSFIWDPTEPIATRPLVFYEGLEPSQYYTHDGNKNVSDIVFADTVRPVHSDYTPYGNVLTGEDMLAIGNPFLFSSECHDILLNLTYYNSRHYSSIHGRWCARDPVPDGKMPPAEEYRIGNNAPNNGFDVLGETYVWHPLPFPGATKSKYKIVNFQDGTWGMTVKARTAGYYIEIDDGHLGFSELWTLSKEEFDDIMLDTAKRLCRYDKIMPFRTRLFEPSFDTRLFAGQYRARRYYFIEGQDKVWADNEVNYIGIGMYEAWMGASRRGAHSVVWIWKAVRWNTRPTDGTFKWLDYGYDNFKTWYGKLDPCTCELKSKNVKNKGK